MRKVSLCLVFASLASSGHAGATPGICSTATGDACSEGHGKDHAMLQASKIVQSKTSTAGENFQPTEAGAKAGKGLRQGRKGGKRERGKTGAKDQGGGGGGGGGVSPTKVIKVTDDNGYNVPIRSWINGSGAPIVVFFHGRNGKAKSQLPQQFVGGNVCFFSAQGSGDWRKHNLPGLISKIVDEAAAQPECDVSKGVTVGGTSQGCAYTLVIMLENHDKRLARFACSVTQLKEDQYKDGKFVTQHGPPMKGRMLWTFLGGRDRMCPANGGKGPEGRLMPHWKATEIWNNWLGSENVATVVDAKAGHGESTAFWKGIVELSTKTNVPFEADAQPTEAHADGQP